MEKRLIAFAFFTSILILSLAFVSAGFFSNLLDKRTITGNVVEIGCTDSDTGIIYDVRGETKITTSTTYNGIIYEGQTLNVFGKNVSIEYMSAEGVKLNLQGEITSSLSEQESEEIFDGNRVIINDLNYLSYENSSSSVNFSINLRKSATDYCYLKTTGAAINVSTCSGSDCMVAENFCSSIGIQTRYYECSGNCSNGACIPTNQTTYYCTDTDGGIKYDIKGEATGYGVGTIIYIDHCLNDAILNESYCDGNYPKTLTRDCGMENKVCSNGACKSITTNLSCANYTYSNCPSYCTKVCASGCNTSDSNTVCLDFCDGPGSCITKTNITCKNLYWIDSNNKNCTQKEFCGAYMYYSLQTFETREKCLNALIPVRRCISNMDCPQIALPPENYRECNGNQTCQVSGGYTCVDNKCVLSKSFYNCQNCTRGCWNGTCGTSTNQTNPTNNTNQTIEPTRREICINAGGTWKIFSNGCADSCELVRNMRNVACTQVITEGCDCGPDKCWAGTRCELNNESAGIITCNSGCLLNQKCYTFGYRKSGVYCAENNAFIPQLGNEAQCENNFECKSNLCIDGQCMNQGLMKKFMSWIKNINRRN